MSYGFRTIARSRARRVAGMGFRGVVRVASATALLLVGAAGAASGTSLERYQTYLREMQSARGTFEQRVYDRGRKLVQEARGSFAFARPGRFRWVYQSPNPQQIVGDGARVWMYDEDLNQVTVRRMSQALGATPAALLAGGAEIGEAFALSDAGEEDGLAWLQARPREREAGFESVRLGFGPAGIEAMVLVDHFGQTTTLRFRNLVRNPRLDPALFRFTPPAGADVLGER